MAFAARQLPLAAVVCLALDVVGCDVEGDVSFSSSVGDEKSPVEIQQPTLPGTLTFVEPGDVQNIVTAEAVIGSGEHVHFESSSSNYADKTPFVGVPFAQVLRQNFSAPALKEAKRAKLTARDGYAVDVSLDALLSDAALLTFGHKKPGDFKPVGERAADPRPFYLLWRGSEYNDEKKYPRPWAIEKVELLSDAGRPDRSRPPEGFGDNAIAERGHGLFAQSCIRCHAINQQGGKLGPDLNVPQNILAYRPEEQVRAYIKDPATFRYSTMPAHPDLGNADLDALIAYLKLMGAHQSDPSGAP